MDINKIVGENIRKYRKERGMTQRQLGERVGVHHNTISYYEKGINAPEQNKIFLIARELGIAVGDLFPDTTTNEDESFIKGLLLSGKLSKEQEEFFAEMIKKAHSLDEKAREDFFKNIRFAVKYFDENM